MAKPRIGSAQHPTEPFPGGSYPLVLVQDVPFFMPEWLWGRSGPDPGPDFYLRWAAEHCKLRKEPLRPPDDLFSALAELERRSESLPRGNDPRRQVWQALESVTGLPVPEPTYPSLSGTLSSSISDSDWQRLRSRAESLEVYWDLESQSYRARRQVLEMDELRQGREK